MHEDGYFDERIAARYDESSAEMFDPALVGVSIGDFESTRVDGFDEYDVAIQGLTSHHVEIVEGRVERFSPPFRYVWPSELDLMAALAGMTLRERWGEWKREPFTSESRKHVSVWEKSAV